MTYDIAMIAKRGSLRAAFFCGLLALALSNAHASALGNLAASMQPGEFKVLNTNNFGGGAVFTPSGGDGSIMEYSDEAQRNPITKKIYIIGCAKGSVPPGYICGSSTSLDGKFIVYDEATNSWAEMPSAPISLFPHSFDRAALDPATGDYYYRSQDANSKPIIMRLSGGSWNQLPNIPNSDGANDAIEYFPELGGLVAIDPESGGVGAVYLYKPSDNSWQNLASPLPLGVVSHFTEYSAKHKLMFLGGGWQTARTLFKLDATGKLTRVADPPIDLEIRACGSVNTVDPVSGNLVIFSCDGNVYSYDPVSNAWAKHGTHTLASAGYGALLTAAVPAPEYGVIFLASYYGGGKGDVKLYKHSPGSALLDTVPPAAPLNLKVK